MKRTQSYLILLKVRELQQHITKNKTLDLTTPKLKLKRIDTQSIREKNNQPNIQKRTRNRNKQRNTTLHETKRKNKRNIHTKQTHARSPKTSKLKKYVLQT